MGSERKRSAKGPLFLLLASVIWGFSLVTQQTGMELLGPWSFTAVRCTLGGLSMVLLCAVLDRKRKKREPDFDIAEDTKKAVVPGCICGVFLLGTIISQQYGLLYTSVGKGSFITAFYIFLIPLLSLFTGKKPGKRIWFSVVIAMVGLYLITMSGGFGKINRGDVWMLGAALFYSLFTLAGYGISEDCNTVKVSCIQCFVIGLPAFIGAAIFEPGEITWANCTGNPFPIVWAGIVSCAVGYCCQLVGQKYTEPGPAALILSSETVISLFAGWLFLHEKLSGMEYLGCLIMCAAILLSLRKDKNE